MICAASTMHNICNIIINDVQFSGNYYIILVFLLAHLGIAVCFFVGYRTSIMTVTTFSYCAYMSYRDCLTVTALSLTKYALTCSSTSMREIACFVYFDRSFGSTRVRNY